MTTAQTTLEWSPLWEAMKADKSAWIPTTESMYWEMLECLPPRAMRNGAFLVGEADHHDSAGHAVYACFRQIGDSFAAKYMTAQQFSEGIK